MITYIFLTSDNILYWNQICYILIMKQLIRNDETVFFYYKNGTVCFAVQSETVSLLLLIM